MFLPRQFHIQSLTESPQLSERNQAGIRAPFTKTDPTLLRASSGGVGRGPHLLSTVTTAFPGPGPHFPHSTIPTPDFLIVLVSGLLDSFGSVISHLVSENPM